MKLQNKAISIRKRLSNYAREHQLVYQNVETSFLLERLVVRITSSKKLQDTIIFKGGYVGLRVHDSGRYTTDLDAIITSPEVRDTLMAIRTEAEKTSYDVVWFRFEEESDLKTQDKYGGIRQTYRAGIGEIPDDTGRSQKIDTVQLRRGWSSAVSTVRNASSFEHAYQTLVRELRRMQI